MKARHNPLAPQRLSHIRYILTDIKWNHLLDKLETLQHRAAIVGSQGTGKTTLLEDLRNNLIKRGFNTLLITLKNDYRYWWKIFLSMKALKQLFFINARNTFILLDGAEQLSPITKLLFKTLTRTAKGIIITSHQPTMFPTLVECKTNLPLLKTILRTTQCDGLFSDQLLHDCFDKHKGNIRNTLRDLYDYCAQL